MQDHAGRVRPGHASYLEQFTAMDMDERWLDRPPEVMLETFHWFRGEGFELIVEDLLRLPTDTGVIVEGFRLLPRLVLPLLAVPDRAVWLLPTPEFRAAAFDSRGTTWDIPRRTSAPARARHNLLERDRMFTDCLAQETTQLGLRTITVTTTKTENELTDQVADVLGL